MKTIGTLFGRTVFYEYNNLRYEDGVLKDAIKFLQDEFKVHADEILESGVTIESASMPLSSGLMEEYLVVNNQGYLSKIAKSMQAAEILSVLLFLTDDGCEAGQDCFFLYTNIGADASRPVLRDSHGYKLIGNASKSGNVVLQWCDTDQTSFREVNADLVIGIKDWEVVNEE